MRLMARIASADRTVIPLTYMRSTSVCASCASKAARSLASLSPGFAPTTPYLSAALRPQLQSDQDARGVREVADDLAQRRRQAAHERGHGHDLVARGELRILEQVDH